MITSTTQHPPRRRRRRTGPCRRAVALAGLGILLALAGCTAEEEPADLEEACPAKLEDGTCVGVLHPLLCHERYCTDGVSCSAVHYVDATAGEEGDGSTGRPFQSLAAAAESAASGECIALAPGEYTGAEIAGGVSLLGQGAQSVVVRASAANQFALTCSTGEGATLRGVTLGGPGRGLSVRGALDLTVEDVRVDAAIEVGLHIAEEGSVTLRRTSVLGTLPNAAKEHGIGVVVTANSSAHLERVYIHETAGIGVIAAGSSLALQEVLLEDTGSYGLAFDCPAGSCPEAAACDLRAVEVRGSQGVGIWGRGGRVQAEGLLVTDVGLSRGIARGVELQQASVSLADVTITRGEGTGLLLDDSEGVVQRTRVTELGERGIWLQNIAAPLELKGISVAQTHLVGIGALLSQGVTIQDADIQQIKAKTIISGPSTATMGDGLQLLDVAAAIIRDSQITSCARAGLVADNAEGSLSGIQIATPEQPLVMQNETAGGVTLDAVVDASGAALSPVISAALLQVVKVPVGLVGMIPIPLP